MSILAMASGKGGTGKSCVAAYTGFALAQAGKKTVLVEMGACARSLDLIAGVQETAVFDITDVLEGRCDAARAILHTPLCKNLHVLCGPLTPRKAPASEAPQTEQLLRTLQTEYDYVILDGVDYAPPPMPLPDAVWMIVTPDSLCVRASADLARALYEAGVRNMRLVINNVPSQVPPIYGARDFDSIIDQIGAQLIGVIPASPKLQYSANNGEALDPSSLTVRIFENLAARLQGQRRPLLIR